MVTKPGTRPVSAPALSRWIAEVFTACVVASDDAATAASVLTRTTLRGSLTSYIETELAEMIGGEREESKPTPGFQRVIQRAVIHVQSSGRDEVTGANVLVAIFAERESHAAYFLQEQDMTRYDAVNYISHGIAKRAGMSEARPPRGTEEDMSTTETSAETKKKTDALEAYCVNLNDKAVIANETQRSRENKEDSGIDNFFGKPKVPIMNTPVPTRIFTGDSSSSSDGKGTINRQEALTTNVAAVITQVLPNGNLVIEGKQEIRVNFEVRELIIAGIVRPEDIQSDNTLDSAKIAEARIAHGGRGQITDVQQPRYGQQVLDVLLPF